MDKRCIGINYASLKNYVIKAVFFRKLKKFELLKFS